MDLGHYTAGYKLYHKVAVPKKTDTLKPNFTINSLSKLAWGQKSSHYIKDNANCKPYCKFHCLSAFIGHTPWKWIYHKFKKNIIFWGLGLWEWSIFKTRKSTLFYLFPVLNSESLALFEECFEKQLRKRKRKLWKKTFALIKHSKQSFFHALSSLALCAFSNQRIETILKKKPVH